MNSSPAEGGSEEIAPTGDFADLQRRIAQHSQRLSQHACELRRLRDDLDDLEQRFRSA